MTGCILIVDDERSMCEALAAGLTPRGFHIHWTTSGADALDTLASTEFDVVLTDLNMKGMNGLELCERIVTNRPDLPVVVITAFGSFETAVAAIRAGAYDFVTKPVKVDALALVLERAVQHRSLRQEVKRLRQLVADARPFEDLLGNSPAMRRVHELLARLGETDSTVLITGESGTGKELVARGLHRHSRRRGGPFVAVNCAALPEALLESELFGHARGAFTDAHTERAGLFVQANEGTLFLDEIAELPLALQPKLLRALQERTVRPLGGDAEIACEVRLIAATNRDLEAAVEEKRFREDLYFRINVIHVPLPPLRSRGSDVLLLAQQFLTQFATRLRKHVTGLSPGAAERLLAYGWPGNVRELQNSMERAVALTQFEQITIDDLPEKIRAYKPSQLLIDTDDPSELVPLEQIERRYILRVLEAVSGNKTLAAQTLSIGRKTLYRKLVQYGVLKASDEDAQ
jgi:DNA-binding NtrC family response regulator